MPIALRCAGRRAKHTALFLALSALLSALPAWSGAQSVLGVGDDATTVPRGVLRWRAVSEWLQYAERYGMNTPGRKNGALEPLAVNFGLDTLGLSQLATLAPLQSGIRTLAGMPDFVASLGKSVVQLRNQVQSTPLSLELGLTNRITIGASVPFVTASANVSFAMNPKGIEGTLGFNPAFKLPSVLAQNGALISQFDSAASQLGRAIATCAALPSAPGCTAINANAAAARALIQSSTSFATALASVYGGRNGKTGALYVPTAGSTAQLAIAARVAAFRTLYGAFGLTIAGNAPGGAAPLTITDAQRIFTDSAFGMGAKPLATSITRGMGDVDFTIKVNLYDSFGRDTKKRLAPKGFNIRQSIGGVYRLGTGTTDSPDDFTDIGTGNHQNDVELRSYTDVMWGPHFWVSLVAKYNWQLADQLIMRITEAPSLPLAAAYRKQMVTRDLGDIAELEINPRWSITEHVSIAGQYTYRRKFNDQYTGSFAVNDLNGTPIIIDASALNQETEAREHRFGGGISFSTLAAFERGEVSLPFEVSYLHFQTTLGSGGAVPKLTQDQVQFRVYTRLFGR